MDCPSCGRTNRAGARFCDDCGARLAAPGLADGAVARKVVTIVFADLIGSTALHERLDAESTRGVMDRYYQVLRAPVEAHGGRVVKLLGDGLLAAFGVPRVAEDDAIRAVRAAVGMQQAFRRLADDQAGLVGAIGLRVAVNSGEVVVSPDQAEVVGDPVNVAARLQQEAADGDVIVGESTRRLVGELVTLAPLGTFALKGRTERVAAYRVVSLDRPAGAAAIPFVGRDEELGRLARAYGAAVAAPGGRLVVILGSPGLGKSRLVGEFARRLGAEATVLIASCEAAGGATFAPLARALRAFLGVDDGADADALRAAALQATPGDDADRARIASGIASLLAGTPATPEETFFVVRRLLTALSTTRPVVLAIDDLQWAEPLLLDLVEHLVQWSGGAPLLVLGAARPELRDARASLTLPGGLVSDVVTLAGLDAGAATRLAAHVIGADVLPAAVAGRVLAASEGNPLFVGELVRMLVDDGALKREGDRWTVGVELAQLEMPPTIHALLAARIERLAPEERAVLERAAVIGRQFSRAAVAHLLPQETQADLDARIETLRRSELIEPDTSWFLGDPALRFHHTLVRDAAYRRVLKATRAELHARVADWIEARVLGAVEHDETIGWHLEQAHHHLRELGPLDERGRGLGDRAARHLAAAGRRALAHDDVRVAASLLGRAVDRLDKGDPARADLALDWCEALLAAGDVDPATRAIAELGRITASSDRLRAWHVCFTGQLAVLADPKSLHATADAVAAAAETLAAAGDTAGEAKAHSVHALALQRLGRIGASEAALDRALAAARRAQDRRRANAVLAGAPLAALWGPSPVTRASGRCLDVVRVLRITQGAPAVEAVALLCQAVLEALRGRIDAARRMLGSARRLLEDLGIVHRLLEADVFAGLIDLLDADIAGAETRLRGAYDGLREHGLGVDAAQAAAYLGRALLALGRAAEAERLSEESEALAGDDLQVAIAWRGVRAEALARRGEHERAIELARAAVDLAAGTDGLLHHANARLTYSAALRAAGRDAEADAEQRRAIELWESKGATLLAERVRGGSAETSGRASAESSAPTRRRVRRRVRPNHATTQAARVAATAAARDDRALEHLYTDDLETINHPTGTTYGLDETLHRFHEMLGSAGFALVQDPIATLGDDLALCRATVSSAAVTDPDMPFGAVEMGVVTLIEADEDARASRFEIFAEDRLSEAVARLYERLPDGSERMRAATTARTVATMLGQPDLDDWRAIFAPGIEFIDLRNVGFGSLRGADTVVRTIGALFELSENFTLHVDDVLGLRPDALLVCWTNSGTDRASGGTFERDLCQTLTFDAGGHLARWEQTDAARADEALARFEGIGVTPSSARGSIGARRVRPNLASRTSDRLNDIFATRNVEALNVHFGSIAECVDHATGAVFDAGGVIGAWRRLIGAEGPAFRQETIATLGDRLALVHAWMSFAALTDRGLPFGAVDREEYVLVETDAAGRVTRAEQNFRPDHLAAAVERLYDRYAALLPEGSERTRAATTASTVAAMLRADVDGTLPSRFAPGIEFVDHRPIGMEPLHGADVLRRAYKSQREVAHQLEVHIDDVLALRPDACLLHWTTRGTDRAGGGTFERQVLMLRTFDAHGLIARIEWFDPDRGDEALARFDELSTPSPTVARIENAATRCMDRFARAWTARDWEVASIYTPDFRLVDRRTVVQLDLDGEQHLRGLRPMFDMESSRFALEQLATRGDHLALARARFEAAGGAVGPIEAEWLQVIEANDEGDCSAMVMFDVGDLDAAYAELDRCDAAGDAAAHARVSGAMRTFLDAFGRRDWAALAALFAPDLVVHDQRRLGWQTLRGPAAYVESLRSLVDLAPDVRLRLEHVRASDRALLWVAAWQGTRDGGAFETPWIVVSDHDALGRIHRFDQYDLDQTGEALERFRTLASPPTATPSIENAATCSLQRFERAWEAHDWTEAAAVLAPGFRQIDRRRLMRLDLDRAQHLEFMRTIFDLRTSRLRSEVIATRGERLALARLRFEGAGGTTGPNEIESLGIIEVDERGDRTAMIRFDPDALDAAYDELEDRHALGEAAPFPGTHAMMRAMLRATSARDWEALAALFHPDFKVYDHRPLGRVALDGRGLIESMRSLVDDFAPDAKFSLDHASISERAIFSVATWRGTRDGGAFESPRLVVAEIDAEGPIRGFDFYVPDQLAEARARFDMLRAKPSGDVPRIPPNAATRAGEAFAAALAVKEWDAFERMVSPTLVFEDRRRSFLTTGGRDMFLADSRLVGSTGARLSRKALATLGDRLALEHRRWTGTEPVAFEVESLEICEVDGEGRVVAVVVFDPDGRRAAAIEMFERYFRSEGAHWTPRAQVDLVRALNDHDVGRLRAALPDDFVFHDHRRTGVGRIGNADDYVASMAAVFVQSHDVTADTLYYVAVAEPGSLGVGRLFGTLVDGGPFESVFVRLSVYRGGRVVGIELFEIEDLDRARARFEELRAEART
jgi:class 3 adenylate cyclase/tetratricopeptide (TPR) repeat protein/ketosteroid isomerase-like protein